MKRTLIAVCLMTLATLTFAAPANDELTMSASLFNPNDGDTMWSATGEYLIGLTPHFILGPSLSLYDLGDTDGTAFGLAGELGIGRTSGLFLGGALHALGGDAGDTADFTGEARFGVKFGGERGFVKMYASQVWSQAADHARTSPDGTSFQAGLGLRF